MSCCDACSKKRISSLRALVRMRGGYEDAAEKLAHGDTKAAGETAGATGGAAGGGAIAGPGGAVVGAWIGRKAGGWVGSQFSGPENCRPGEDPNDPECDGQQVIVGVQLQDQRKLPATGAFPSASTVDHSQEAAVNAAALQEAIDASKGPTTARRVIGVTVGASALGGAAWAGANALGKSTTTRAAASIVGAVVGAVVGGMAVNWFD